MTTSYIDAQTAYGEIYCWTRNSDGELELFVQPANHYNYLFIPNNTDEETGWTDMFGRSMKKIQFDDTRDMMDFAKRHSHVHESDVGIVYKFLTDNFGEEDVDGPVNVGFYDIEVDFDLSTGKNYPSVRDPFGEINAISLFDKVEQRYVMFMLTDEKIKLTDRDKKYPVINYTFSSERQLLADFCTYIDHIDILAGWNSGEFDLPYIMERLIKNFGQKKALTMLCRNELPARKKESTNDFQEEVWTWTLCGRVHLDMMQLYIKFNPKSLDSNSLNSICEKELGEQKDDYDGDLGDLYRENPEAFFNYSINDSRLLLLLDQKLGIIDTAVMLSRINNVLMTDVTGSVKPIETALMKFCHEQGIVLPDKREPESNDLKGAVVYDTIAGLHGWSFSIDLSALYPSVMMMLGLSTETIIGQCLDWDKDFYRIIERENVPVMLELTDGSQESAYAWEIDDLIRSSGYTISACGTIYTGEMGILSRFVERGFLRRKQFKKQSAAAFDAGDSANGTRFDLLQRVTKIGNNSVYGCISNKYFRLFDIRMARSITYTGAIVSKRQAQSINDIVNRAVAGVNN